MSDPDGHHEPDRLGELIHSRRVAAPDGLRRRVTEMRAGPPRRWRGRVLGLALAGLATAGILVSAVLLAGGGDEGTHPSAVAQAAAASLRAPVGPAPTPRSDRPVLLDVEADGLAFPDWAPDFGLRAAGVRVDHIAGRRVTSVCTCAGELVWVMRSRPGRPYRRPLGPRSMSGKERSTGRSPPAGAACSPGRAMAARACWPPVGSPPARC